MSALDDVVKEYACYNEDDALKQASAFSELEALRAENAKLSANNLDFIRANNEVGKLNADLQEKNAKLREVVKTILRGQVCCPVCGAFNTEKHDKDCELAALKEPK